MYTKQEIIIDSFRQGKSQRAIARDLQINRKTVKSTFRSMKKLYRQLTLKKLLIQKIYQKNLLTL